MGQIRVCSSWGNSVSVETASRGPADDVQMADETPTHSFYNHPPTRTSWPTRRHSLAAAAGTAWYSRQQIATTATNSTTWLTSHLEFVGVLWKPELLRERLEEVVEMAEDSHIQFHW